MANPWFRLWTDMVTDPKWRTISKKSGESIGDVISVYLHLMTCASNATERGRTQGFDCEDVANALNIEELQVQSILDSMEGRVIENGLLTGWEKRQPIREDGAALRAKEWRENQKRTQPNATERKKTLDTDKNREEEIKKETKSKASAPASRLPADWAPDGQQLDFCKTERPDLNPALVADRFRDYWISQPDSKAKKADWMATWRNWVRNEKVVANARASPPKAEKFDPVAHVNRNKVNQNARDSNIIDGAIFEVVPTDPSTQRSFDDGSFVQPP